MNILQRKILLTISVLTIARLGIFIPLPGIEKGSLENIVSNNTVFNFLTIFSGGGYSGIGIFALGIVPFINSSIAMQFLIPIIPKLERLQKEEGEFGRKRISQISKILTVVLALGQALFVAFWLKPYIFNWDYSFVFQTTLGLTAGALTLVWFAEIITERGIGNGSSLLILGNIVSGFSKLSSSLDFSDKNVVLINTLILVIIMVGVIFVQEATRMIPIVSARQLQTSNTKQSNYIPLRLNQAGIMPIIFASSFSILPISLLQALPVNFSELVGNEIFGFVFKLVYFFFYFILILFFSFFYTSLTFNCEDIAKNLRKMASSIIGVKPGINTKLYLQSTSNRLAFLGALFLSLLIFLPNLIEFVFHISSFQGLGITSLLIIIGIAIETSKQIETYLILDKYDTLS
jgi:preprotein translocase subunit SecY